MTDEYLPNKYTRRILIKDWERIMCDGGGIARIIDPKYLNEPGDFPWRDEVEARKREIK